MNTRLLLLVTMALAGCAQPTTGAPGAPPQSTQDTKVNPETFDPLSSEGFSDLEKRAAAGDVNAQYEVGARYAKGISVKADPAKGYGWLKKAADCGESRAERRVGDMLFNGEGTAADARQGVEWLIKAAQAGDAPAQNALGLAYYNGTGVAKDYGKAFEWLLKVAQRGLCMAQNAIAGMYAQGLGVAQDWKAAREWWERAAAQNDAEALYNLAMTCFEGRGVEANPKAGISLLVRASLSGGRDAELFLGNAYANGIGVPKDATKARDLIEAAARAGSAQAQDYVGRFLASGTVGTRDYQKARTWFARAAAQGFTTAQGDLGRLLQEGLGGTNDPVEALKWFDLAADRGLQEAVSRRKEISLFLESAQIQEAKRRADAFEPEPSHPVDDDEATAVCPLLDWFRIPVRVPGKTNYLVVDTGATLSGLDIANKDLPGEPLARENVATIFQQQEMDIYSCPGLFIGERRFAPLWTMCSSFEKMRMLTGEPCDGFLGMLCLRNYVVTFDPDKHRFSLGGAVPESVRKGALAIPLKRMPTHANPVIEANVNGIGPIYFELDTGNNCGISLSQQDWQKVFQRGEPRTMQTYHIGIGDQGELGKEARVQSVIIGTNQYTNLIAGTGTAYPSSLLGQDFFRRHVCTIDFPNQMLYLLPGEHFRDPDEENMSGILLARLNGRTVVYLVDEDSPAFEAGIRKDDQILSINGQDVAPLKMKTIREMLQSQPGAKIKVEVKRGEKPLQFTFVDR